MDLVSARLFRVFLAVLLLPLAVACPGPNPPPADTTAPTTRAEPRGGSFNAPVEVTLSCDDGEGSGCAATRYTTDGSEPTSASSRYIGRLRFTATTTLKFFSVDAAGNAETVKTEQYTVDIAAPTVSASPRGRAFNSAQTVTLSCTPAVDVSCGPIRYTTDGSTPTASSPAYSAPLAVNTTTTLRFFATDSVGKASQVVTETYVIDTTPPTVSANPAGGAYNAAQTVSLSCVDGAGSGCASIRYTRDGTTPTPTSAEYTAPLTVDSNTTLRFIAIDAAGNASAAVSATYIIDTVAPTVSPSRGGGFFATAQTVTLSCDDGPGSSCTIYYTLDGSPPTPTSSRYTTPLSITTDTTLRFISVDAVGNQSSPRTETFVLDTTPPTLTLSPVPDLYADAQTVTVTCSDGAGSGCGRLFYTTDGSFPDPTAAPYTGPISLTTSTLLRFWIEDQLGNYDSQVGGYFIGINPASISAQIAAVRAAADGATNLLIERALVTYVKPLVGTEPAGFFIQAEQNGPALFIAVNPASLGSPPAPGRRVSLRATQKTTVEGRVQVTAIANYSVVAADHPVEPRRADVTNVDLPAMLGNYESELIAITARIRFGFSGDTGGFVMAPLETAGAPISNDILLRLPSSLQAQLNSLRVNCNVTVRAPLWRSNAQALVTAWRAEDITINSCQ